MNIYQLHQIGGSYDDAYDMIIATYLSARKAISHMRELKKEQKAKIDASIKCCRCPVHDLTKRKYKNKKHLVDEYCDNANIAFDGNFVFCNSVYRYYDDEYYTVEKINVIE